ncbi:stage V sporulation protein AE [Clostridium sp.]|uniref:stage V sporulation protein AE n=1 Tax=Clostridium sp. TaxID=1506 RepID=UPI002FCA5A12
MEYIKAFIVGGGICVLGQILIDKTSLTPARILVLFVTSGVILQGFGLYEYLIDFAKAGASVPLPGFGYSLAKGAIEEVDKIGLLGAFTGGVKATSAGIAAAVFFGYLMSIIFTPKSNK